MFVISWFQLLNARNVDVDMQKGNARSSLKKKKEKRFEQEMMLKDWNEFYEVIVKKYQFKIQLGINF